MAARFLDRDGLFIVGLGAVALLSLAFGGYFLFNPPQVAERPGGETGTHPMADTTHAVVQPQSSDTATGVRLVPEVLVPGEDGRTVLDLLEASHKVEIDTELLVFGSIVLAIDSVHAGPSEYWVYYRDSLPGVRPPEACTTQTGETIRWILKHRR